MNIRRQQDFATKYEKQKDAGQPKPEQSKPKNGTKNDERDITTKQLVYFMIFFGTILLILVFIQNDILDYIFQTCCVCQMSHRNDTLPKFLIQPRELNETIEFATTTEFATDFATTTETISP